MSHLSFMDTQSKSKPLVIVAETPEFPEWGSLVGGGRGGERGNSGWQASTNSLVGANSLLQQ